MPSLEGPKWKLQALDCSNGDAGNIQGVWETLNWKGMYEKLDDVQQTQELTQREEFYGVIVLNTIICCFEDFILITDE